MDQNNHNNEEKELIESYLSEIASTPLLTEEETRQLMQTRAAALQRIVHAHLHLVEPIAREFAGRGRNQVDLILAGNIGLIHAVETYDTSTQEPFSSYALRSIRATIAHDRDTH